MNSDRRKPGVAFWATVAVVGLPLLYVASFGPACWLARMEVVSVTSVAHAYSPLVKVVDSLPDRSRVRHVAEQCAVGYSGKDQHGSYMFNTLSARLHYEKRTGNRASVEPEHTGK